MTVERSKRSRTWHTWVTVLNFRVERDRLLMGTSRWPVTGWTSGGEAIPFKDRGAPAAKGKELSEESSRPKLAVVHTGRRHTVVRHAKTN